jgi:hypothetical protein
MLFTAYMGCANIAATVMSDLGYANLGLLELSVTYFTFAWAAIFAVPINKALGTRLTFVFGCCCYLFWILGFLIPAYKHE